jgi:uncharacterized protein
MSGPPTPRTRVRRHPERGVYDRETIDALVLARSTPMHSMNDRSVIVYASAREVVEPDEMDLAQRALVEHVVPGRTVEARMPNAKELKETAILALGLEESSAKGRTGGGGVTG